MFRIAAVAALIWATEAKAQDSGWSQTITEADCSSPKLGDNIPASAIGEPVSAASLSAPQWTPGAKGQPRLLHHQRRHGANRSRAQRPTDQLSSGGGGMNGFIPPLTAGPGSPFARGFVTYGRDSGHQAGGYDGGSCRCHETAGTAVILASAFAALLFAGALLNWIFDATRDIPTKTRRQSIVSAGAG